ncbi:MAG: hypothetical protein ACPGTP_01340 [Bacteroidia bacterium]
MKSPEGKVIAEAFGNKLYETELESVISADASLEDSIFITKEYINVWLNNQVLLNQAEVLLSPSEKDKSKELAQYKADLLSYEVLNKLAVQELDTSFREEELLSYYNDNLDEFELSQNIIKIVFYKVPRDAEDIGLLWRAFKAGDQSINGKLRSLSELGGNYFTDKTTWVYFDDILKEIPINTYNQEHYLNNNKFIRLNDGSFVYFIEIIDFKIRSTTSPFSMERNNIREFLLMKRQQKLVKSIETKLLEEAYRKKQIQIF